MGVFRGPVIGQGISRNSYQAKLKRQEM